MLKIDAWYEDGVRRRERGWLFSQTESECVVLQKSTAWILLKKNRDCKDSRWFKYQELEDCKREEVTCITLSQSQLKPLAIDIRTIGI
jgi:hypothetical protein